MITTATASTRPWDPNPGPGPGGKRRTGRQKQQPQRNPAEWRGTSARPGREMRAATPRATITYPPIPTAAPTIRHTAGGFICNIQYQSSWRSVRDSNASCAVNQKRLNTTDKSRRNIIVAPALQYRRSASASKPATRLPAGPPESAIADHFEQRNQIDVRSATCPPGAEASKAMAQRFMTDRGQSRRQYTQRNHGCRVIG